MQNWREAHMFYLAREVGKIWRCSCWEKGNFIMINKFKYCQTWKFDRLYLVYHFTVPLKSTQKDSFVYLPQSANTRHSYLPDKRLGMKFTLLSNAYNFSQLTTHNTLKQSKNASYIKLQPLKNEKSERQMGQ